MLIKVILMSRLLELTKGLVARHQGHICHIRRIRYRGAIGGIFVPMLLHGRGSAAGALLLSFLVRINLVIGIGNSDGAAFGGPMP